MFHQRNHYNHQGHSNILSSKTEFPQDRHLFLRGGGIPGESSLVLSTDAKPRLKWTPELHERFIEALNQLGGADKATPKTVMRLMGIPGLTLYHLKSHLQKYRLSKNLHAQANCGGARSAITCILAAEGTSDSNAQFMATAGFMPQPNKTMPINEALQMQIEVQRQLHEQIEVQRHLQQRIEAQGKYLQTVLEKAQETLGKQNNEPAGLEAAKTQLYELENFSNSFQGLEEIPGTGNLLMHKSPNAEFSAGSAFTSFNRSHKRQDNYYPDMTLGTYNGNFTDRGQQKQDCQFAKIEPVWSGDFGGQKACPLSTPPDSETTSFPIQMDTTTLISMSTNKGNRAEVLRRENEEKDAFCETTKEKIQIVEQKPVQKPESSGLSRLTIQLDLSARENNEAPSCKKIDLNGFGWN